MPDRVSEIRARLEAATPGPWTAHDTAGAHWLIGAGKHGPIGNTTFDNCQANAEFIAHAPADLDFLLSESARKDEEIARLTKHVAWLCENARAVDWHGGLLRAEAIRANVLPNLDLVTTGVLPPNPAELMMSGTLAALLQRLSADYDYVIVDTPPVLVAADTPAMAAQAGTLLLVARAGETNMGEVHEAAKRLAHAGKPITGVLLNALDLSRRYYGSYAYKYGGYQYRQYKYVQGE